MPSLTPCSIDPGIAPPAIRDRLEAHQVRAARVRWLAVQRLRAEPVRLLVLVNEHRSLIFLLLSIVRAFLIEEAKIVKKVLKAKPAGK